MDTKWQDITRRLDLGLASVETRTEKEKARGRAITKLRRSFVIPAYYIDHITPFSGIMQPSRVTVQYNYTAPAPFRILNPERLLQLQAQQKIPYCVLCIAYREGNTKMRYRLTKHKQDYTWLAPYVTQTNPLGDPASYFTQTQADYMPLHGTPLYNFERIPVNFSIELWTYRYYWAFSIVNNTTDTPPQGLLTDVELETNLLYNPVSSQDVGDVFEEENSIIESDMTNAIPETLPVSQTELVQWLDNV
jgi:hypothetical protein